MKQFLIKLIPSLLLVPLQSAYTTYKRFCIKKYLKSSKSAAAGIGNIDRSWRRRIDDVISSSDNAQIPRCANAGKLEGFAITMHNGVRVCANGYYGSGVLNMLIENKGVHEPQEEKAFEQIIRLVPDECVMLELGAYWGFYSLSLLQERPQSTCFLVEPELQNLISGEINFRLNGREGHFTEARVGQTAQENPKTISVDSFCEENGIEYLHILHSDIQGYEVEMLQGACHSLGEGKVGFVFISTHSEELHTACIEKLESYGYVILAEANMQETFSVDGLIVAKHHTIQDPQGIDISRKTEQPENVPGS